MQRGRKRAAATSKAGPGNPRKQAPPKAIKQLWPLPVHLFCAFFKVGFQSTLNILQPLGYVFFISAKALLDCLENVKP